VGKLKTFSAPPKGKWRT